MADVDINKFRASVVRDGSKPSSPGFIVSEGQDPVNPPGTNNYVPYSGATANVELGEFGVEAGFITLDTTPTNTPTDQGTIFWDADDETVDIILNGYTMKIGEDLFYPVKNQTGSTIAKGVAVRFNGTVGASGRLLIAPFIADGSVPSSRFMGVTAEEILNGEDGKVLYFGRVRGINTNAFNEGDILYASTTVAGGYQTAIPLPPNNIVQVAAVVTKSATVGTIFIRPTLGSNINTDEGVKITSVADKNLLQYQSGTALWENKTLAQVIGGTSAQFVKGDGSLDSTSYGTGTVTSVGLSSATSGVTIGSTPVTTSGTITLAIATASGSQNGLLSSTDWTTFNNKQNALTNPVTGTGTTNYLPKFTGASTIGNSLFTDNGTNGAFGGANYYTGTDLRTFNISAPLYAGLAFWANNQSVGSIIGFGVTGNLILNADQSNLFANTKIILSIDDTERFAVFSNGNVSIGNSPTDNGAKFQVSGRSTVTDNVGGNTIMEVSNTNTTNGFGLFVRGGVGSTSYALNVVNAANTIDLFKVMGSGAATFSSSVTAGGGNAPTLGFQLTTTTGTSTPRLTNDAVNATVIRTGASGSPVVINNFANSSELVRFTDGGNVGINQNNPTGRLEVVPANAGGNEGIFVNQLGSHQSTIRFKSAHSSNSDYRIGASITVGSAFEIYSIAAAASRLVITSSGNVGIGTSSPDANSRLDVNGQTFVAHLAIYNNNGTPSLGTSPMLYSPASATLAISTGTIERMRITSSGNILIGTQTDIGERLTLNGRIGIVGATVASGNYRSFFVRGSQNVADGGTLSINVTNTSLIFIAENNTGTGALFFLGYASSTITKISDPSNMFDTADTAGKLCIFKSAVSDVATIKNRLGSTKNITVSFIGVSD